METCPRKLEPQYLAPKDIYERQVVLRTDKCKADKEKGYLGSFFCKDCQVTVLPLVRVQYLPSG
jgi:hypothetical protein